MPCGPRVSPGSKQRAEPAGRSTPYRAPFTQKRFEEQGSWSTTVSTYSPKPGDITRNWHVIDADDVVSARRHAGLISEALSIALRIARHSDVADDRRAAMESRTTIDIAVGMIMGQNGCAQEVAFGILQRASSQRNVKLRVLAEELVSSAGRSVPKTAFEA